MSDSVKAPIAQVAEQSPFDDAGFYPGCFVTAIDGKPVRDIIDWRWLTAGDEMEVSYIDAEGDAGTVVLEREPGEGWGVQFRGAIFDEVKLCRNACTFCFMRQLPDDVRPSLVLRDDDFRLSFLQGTFVTLTNLTEEDEKRIVSQHISPLRVSLHAVSPDVRRGLIGRHAPHGIAALDRLLEAGVEVHAQIVLLPGVNDGEELMNTLAWAYGRSGIRSVGIVPIGFTKHQRTFSKSFNDEGDARAVIELIEPFRARALAERNTPWVFAADEFYRNAYPNDLLDHLPPASHYGAFEMFEDGIGIIRSFVDDWEASAEEEARLASVLEQHDAQVGYAVGYAQREFLIPLIERGPLRERFRVLPVKNEYFGGNVDVTGLLTASDIVREIGPLADLDFVALPAVMFNVDNMTLDDWDLGKLQNEVSVPLGVVSCNASEYFGQIAERIESAAALASPETASSEAGNRRE
ncbi:DUF512 domain-containing protein [Raoultibacter phocaeensis]|uniref:DUF512 domain-containing protein n=1 Tax=Raoultibacter phocaeensis TaxID=2479841 RepID=UPI00111BBE42|nr:DUF512 domain-containing protein [Raoultibacter phocaeensis]